MTDCDSLLKRLQDTATKIKDRKADDFEIFISRQLNTEIDSKDLKVESLTQSEDLGLSIRLLKDQKLGFSFTTHLTDQTIDQAILSALEMATVMPADTYTSFTRFADHQYSEMNQFDDEGVAIALSEKIEIAKKLESDCKKADSRIKSVRSAGMSETQSEVYLMDSQGAVLSHRRTLFSAGIQAKAEEKEDQQMGYGFHFADRLSDLDIGFAAKFAATQATSRLGAVEAPTMKCPAIFQNTAVSDLLQFLAGSFSLESMDKGRSLLTGKQGEKLFSEHITLIDDGLLSGGYASSPFDGEGVPKQKKALIQNGVFKQGISNLYYAKKMKLAATGNASRGIQAPPSIAISNLYLESGKKDFNSLCEGISRGIIITDLMGMHMANSVTGDFSLGAAGILIENGKPTQAVRGFAVAGNIINLLKQVTDVGNDTMFFGKIKTPSLRVSELSIGGK